MAADRLDELSELIGAIYDCATDPERWPAAIGKICAATNCVSGTIGLYAIRPPALRIQKFWNYDQQWILAAPRYAKEVAEIIQSGSQEPNGRMLPERVFVLSRHPRQDLVENSRFVQEWRRPQGLVDSIQLMVLQEPNRVGMLGINRHVSVGVATDREVETLRQLLPHINRAIKIGDLLDLKVVEAEVLSTIFDALKSAVIVVDRELRILHANSAANTLLRRGRVISSMRDRLKVPLACADVSLRNAVACAATKTVDDAEIAAGILLSDGDDIASTAYVLPLTSDRLHQGFGHSAVAAVFVCSAEEPSSRAVDAIAEIFGLTSAEKRVLVLLADGHSLPEVASTLGIAGTTAKTHLMHIFSKTGVRRQAELSRLVSTQEPPFR